MRWPVWLSYAVSYVFIAIVWANHHSVLPSLLGIAVDAQIDQVAAAVFCAVGRTGFER